MEIKGEIFIILKELVSSSRVAEHIKTRDYLQTTRKIGQKSRFHIFETIKVAEEILRS